MNEIFRSEGIGLKLVCDVDVRICVFEAIKISFLCQENYPSVPYRRMMLSFAILRIPQN